MHNAVILCRDFRWHVSVTLIFYNKEASMLIHELFGEGESSTNFQDSWIALGQNINCCIGKWGSLCWIFWQIQYSWIPAAQAASERILTYGLVCGGVPFFSSSNLLWYDKEKLETCSVYEGKSKLLAHLMNPRLTFLNSYMGKIKFN